MHLAEGDFEVGLMSEAGGKVAANDEVVDIGEEVVEASVEFVEVGDDGDVGGAGPGGGKRGGFGVVSVDVESSGVNYPVTVEVGGAEGEGFIAAPEDGAF